MMFLRPAHSAPWHQFLLSMVKFKKGHPYQIALAAHSWGPNRRTGGPVGSARQRQGQDHDKVYSGRFR